MAHFRGRMPRGNHGNDEGNREEPEHEREEQREAFDDPLTREMVGDGGCDDVGDSRHRAGHDDDRDLCDRDERGRFAPGTSGNPQGRPRRSDQSEHCSVRDRIAAAFAKVVRVREGGKTITMSRGDVLIERLVQDTVTNDSLARQRALVALHRLQGPELGGVLAPEPAEDDNGGITEEMERAFEEIAVRYRDLLE